MAAMDWEKCLCNAGGYQASMAKFYGVGRQHCRTAKSAAIGVFRAQTRRNLRKLRNGI